jgi:hypothetical protein
MNTFDAQCAVCGKPQSAHVPHIVNERDGSVTLRHYCGCTITTYASKAEWLASNAAHQPLEDETK